TPDNFLRPEPAADADVLRVHTADWVNKLKTGTLTQNDVMILEVPYSPELVNAFWLAAGGTILAAQVASLDGFGCNIGGGFHHAYPGHGEGFCAIHDVAVAIRKLLPAVREGLEKFRPQMLFYVGGAVPYKEDQLGGLRLTINGLQTRDRSVFEEARRHQVPVVTTLAGGYARRIEDTVQIHVNTILAAAIAAGKYPHSRKLS